MATGQGRPAIRAPRAQRASRGDAITPSCADTVQRARQDNRRASVMPRSPEIGVWCLKGDVSLRSGIRPTSLASRWSCSFAVQKSQSARPLTQRDACVTSACEHLKKYTLASCERDMEGARVQQRVVPGNDPLSLSVSTCRQGLNGTVRRGTVKLTPTTAHVGRCRGLGRVRPLPRRST